MAGQFALLERLTKVLVVDLVPIEPAKKNGEVNMSVYVVVCQLLFLQSRTWLTYQRVLSQDMLSTLLLREEALTMAIFGDAVVAMRDWLVQQAQGQKREEYGEDCLSRSQLGRRRRLAASGLAGLALALCKGQYGLGATHDEGSSRVR